MADLVETRRRNTLWSINQNPVDITIHRMEKTETAGHFTEAQSQVGPMVVRIFQAGGSARTDSQLAGIKDIDTGWGLLADWQANLRAGPNVRDEVEVQGLGHFIVKVVSPQMVQGQVVGYQATLEKVS